MAHTYTHLVVHALFSTGGRRPILQAGLRPKVFSYMAGIISVCAPSYAASFGPEGEGESQLIEVGQ